MDDFDPPPDFDRQWQRLTAAARRAPPVADPQLDIERILAARRPAPRIVRIGWFPPGLAAAAVLAAAISFAAGLDPRPAAENAALFLADLPHQVPRAPSAFAPPALLLPSPASLVPQTVKDLLP